MTDEAASPESFLARLAGEVEGLLAEIERETGAFADRSGIRCRTGCGQCCLKPAIEARPIELLPLARALHAKGEADEWYERAAAKPSGNCIFYRPDPRDETMGRCGTYELRPSLCRLFGFAAVNRKDGRPELAACHWHKRLQPQVVVDAQQAIDAGGRVPLFSEYALRLSMLSPGTGLDTIMPINEALMRALEKTAFEAGPT